MIKKTFAVAVSCGLIGVRSVASADPVPKPPVLCLQGSLCQQPASPSAPAPSPPPASTIKPPAGSGAIKFQPGWYALFNKMCIPVHGNYGCSAAELVSTINSEICPNANLVGMKMTVAPSFVLGNKPGSYTASNPDMGFAVIDRVLAALNTCGKYLILQAEYGPFSGADRTWYPLFYPAFVYAASQGDGGTASGGAYGVTVTRRQASRGLSRTFGRLIGETSR